MKKNLSTISTSYFAISRTGKRSQIPNSSFIAIINNYRPLLRASGYRYLTSCPPTRTMEGENNNETSPVAVGATTPAADAEATDMNMHRLARYYTVLRDFMSYFHSRGDDMYPPSHEVSVKRQSILSSTSTQYFRPLSPLLTILSLLHFVSTHQPFIPSLPPTNYLS